MKISGIVSSVLAALALAGNGYCAEAGGAELELAARNTERAVQLAETAFTYYFTDSVAMSRFYNPFTGVRSEEKGSVWMYTSSIESVNAVLRALAALKEAGSGELYGKYYDAFRRRLESLYGGLDWYCGTITLTSYTRTGQWSVYGVDRGQAPGKARVHGIYNVYDDQEWLVRELLESYRITGEKKCLDKAEYLAEYVLDGWDATLDPEGNEYGGITWGPGYISKHSCSNGPLVSPLVWLSEICRDRKDKIVYRFIDRNGKRRTSKMIRSEYYLMYAEKVYDFHKSRLLMPEGVFYDLVPGQSAGKRDIAYETVNGVRYRAHNEEGSPRGKAYTYNTGTMISGAADLYRATGKSVYLEDMAAFTDASFAYFARPDVDVKGLCSYPVQGFSPWFNGVLLRGWAEASAHSENAGRYCATFQANLDYAYDNCLEKGMLPPDIPGGWKTEPEENSVEGMFMFAYSAEYAVLAETILSQMKGK